MSPADWIHALGDVADLPAAGGKAQNLARLIAAGLPVPPGFVIDARAFAAALGSATAPTTTPSTSPDNLGHRSAHAADHPTSVSPDDLGHRSAHAADHPTSTSPDKLGHRSAHAADLPTSVSPDDLGHRSAHAADLPTSVSPDDLGHRSAHAADLPTSVSPDDLGHRFAHAAAHLVVSPDLVHRAREHAAALGDQLAVRSSATIEDLAAGSAAGLFSSVTAVPLADLEHAIRAVWSSALTPLVVAYARRTRASGPTPDSGGIGIPSHPIPRDGGVDVSIAVIVQRFVPGERVIVNTRRPGAPTTNDVLVQRGGTLTRMLRDDEDEIVKLALRAEAAIGATGGADVEIVDGGTLADRGDGGGGGKLADKRGGDGGTLADRGDGGGDGKLADARGGDGGNIVTAGRLVVVQARPIVHPVRVPSTPLPRTLIAPLIADGREWTWDVAHNPDPLSTAQAELVSLVERAGVSPYALRVCGGYLYATLRDEVIAPSLDKLDDIERRMSEVLGDENATLTLDDALERFVAFYALWTRELSPLVSVERKKVRSFQSRPSSVEESLVAAAIGQRSEDDVVAHLGVLAPAWDVAVATFGERPDVVREAIARARIAYPRGSESPFDTPDADAIGADLGERDDRWFARAQWMVRRALLALGFGDDVFWIPFADLRAGLDADTARRRAAGARAAAARAANWEPPLVVHGENAVDDIRPVLRGFGTGGRAVGRVVRLASLASAITVGRGDVVVTRAFTPALAVVVIGCAGLISESGELLDHASSMARELGIPAVVGCRDAWRSLDDGQIVEVDGDAGEVRPYSSSSS